MIDICDWYTDQLLNLIGIQLGYVWNSKLIELVTNGKKQSLQGPEYVI